MTSTGDIDARDLDAVIDSLRANQFSPVLGTIQLDEKGDIIAPAYVWHEWADGEYALVK